MTRILISLLSKSKILAQMSSKQNNHSKQLSMDRVSQNKKYCLLFLFKFLVVITNLKDILMPIGNKLLML